MNNNTDKQAYEGPEVDV